MSALPSATFAAAVLLAASSNTDPETSSSTASAALPRTLVDEFSWPQWDGPHRDGRSRESAWSSAGKDENLWEMEVGLGYSTVVAQDGRVYTMGYDREAKLDLVWCLDALTGEELWVHAYESEIWNQAHEGGTVNTPSIDGDRLYTLNREGNAFCLDARTGEEIWHRNVKEEHDLVSPTWGFSASPLLVGDELILNCGKVLSLDKATGDLKWASPDYGHAYGTATAFEANGEPAVAVLNGDAVGLVARATGKELASYPFGGNSRGVNAATPIVIDDALFVSSGPRGGGALLAIGENELVPVWENKAMANSFSGCVRMGDALFGYDGQVLACIDLEGNKRWEERGLGNGAVTGAADRILAMTSRGELVVAKANPDAFEELSRAKLFDAGNYWTKPILVNGIVYCRSSKGRLVARDHRLGDE